MSLSIDVVVLSHDHYTLTASCLRHLAAQTIAHRVIVVDDASTDGTPSRLAIDWPEATVVALARNHGFSAAANIGVAAGSADIVVLLNNDVDSDHDFLEQLVEPLAADPLLGSVAPLMLRPGRAQIDSVGLAADQTLAGFARLRGLPATAAGADRPLLVGPTGAGAAFRRAAWTQVGGFDELIHAYMEDFDLALRLRAEGWKTLAAPRAIGVHLGSASYGARSPRSRRLGGFSRGYLLRRYGVLRSRTAPRALLTEAIAVAADLALSRDLEALRGRLDGWRAAAARPRRPAPGAAVVDERISFLQSLALRRRA
jgi:GT2 family glycosyltransferase